MKKIIKITSLIGLIFVLAFSFATISLAQSVGGASVQTNSATNISNYQATLNGYLSIPYISNSNSVYFQWGLTSNYGSQTAQQYINSGSFSQIVSSLAPNTAFHFRAVSQGNNGTIYGQDMTFYTNQSGSGTVTANAGPDLYLTSGQTVDLQGSGYDQNGYVVNYYWTCNNGTLSNYNIAQPTFTAPYNNQTSSTCTLTVTNSYGNSNSDSTIIYVNSNNNNSNNVQTNSATNISSYQATLNGYLSSGNFYNSTYVYFQWGTTNSYGNQTNQQYINNAGSFSQNVTSLSANTTYHFRAVSQGNNGTIYGQDMTFYTSYGNNYYGNGSLSVNKQAINLTSGNLNWQSSVNAKPLDIISFAITLQPNNQDVHNVVVRDILPANLIYRGNLTVNTNSNYGGDITSELTIGTIYANQPVVVSYQAQVASAQSFSYGATTLTNSATVTSNELGTQTASASVFVNKSLVYGATNISTGLTNNFLTDSFLLPLLILIFGIWLYFSGTLNMWTDKLKTKIKR